jgi:uncharacterized protein (DUF697 family)
MNATTRSTQPRPPDSRALIVLPATQRDVDGAAQHCRRIVNKRALLSAGAAVVPIPGLDLAVDIGVLADMLEEINQAFGLSPEQIDRLAPKRRLSVQKAITALGSSAVGRLITRQLILMIVKSAARSLMAKSTVKYVPIAGQAVAAGISYAAIRYIGGRHIADCIHVARAVMSESSPSGSGDR